MGVTPIALPPTLQTMTDMARLLNREIFGMLSMLPLGMVIGRVGLAGDLPCWPGLPSCQREQKPCARRAKATAPSDRERLA
jgi:hypothetical protein